MKLRIKTAAARRIIRRQDLPQYVGLGLRRIDQLIAEGKFPPLIKLAGGRKAGLYEDVLEAWQQERDSPSNKNKR